MLKFYPGRNFIILVSFCISVVSCSKFDKEEPIPAYISIPSIKLTIADTLKPTQGSASENIVDAWIFLDDKLQGVYELPAKFPVLKEGTYTLKVKPGVKQNGIGSTRPIYPFYTEYTQTINLIPEEIIEVAPVVEYRSYTKFVWIEDFEKTTFSLTATLNNDTTFKTTANPQLSLPEDGKCLQAFLDDQHLVFEYKSKNAFELNTNGSPVFFELNYKTNSPIYIGFIANSATSTVTQPLVTINPSYNDTQGLVWKKMYVNLTDFIGDYYQYDNFNMIIRVAKSSDVALTEFYLDNLKLVQ
ncbi:MAG: hypothetical protein IPP56_02520 [Bacteroidetes bacterium]|nr:hypothetical protein [Bacteroidota bacterium]MBK9673288.1 hypothetical protein [Bacteroidota bacterium]MBK9798634.1 hypothetical protein [Bacteroidota bacterium]MBP6412529.1 hypothetical protein [Bacteroidia bacterium]